MACVAMEDIIKPNVNLSEAKYTWITKGDKNILDQIMTFAIFFSIGYATFFKSILEASV